MRCQHVDDDIQCRLDATRRVMVGCGDPPDPDQAGFAGTAYMVQVCKQHDPDPRLTPVSQGSRFGTQERTRPQSGHEELSGNGSPNRRSHPRLPSWGERRSGRSPGRAV